MRFDHDIHKHWQDVGHDVKYEMGWSEELAKWADVYYVNFWDNNIHAAYHWHQDNPTEHCPKYIVRAIDWECWCGLVRDQAIVDWVSKAICIAPHIQRKLESEVNWNGKLSLIPCGIDTTAFPLKTRFGGFNVVLPCNEIDWILKNAAEGIKIFGMLCKKHPDDPYQLFVRGKWTQGNEYFRVYFKDLVEKLGITDRVHWMDQEVPDYNAFLDDMDYCLVPSFKEAFSYVTGECASKGIKPILNWWYGAEEIWPKQWLYTTPDEAVDMFVHDFYPKNLRDYIILEKNVKDMFTLYDKLLEEV